ncbi:response regulator [Parvibaculum sp.]|uniref:response regulator n=1 Tax=Parvibaculum sp. TaxID=2024848 RepID=UPI002BB32C68|nr:response regulator [Parvibaculum sp.]HUD53314.1 response regulator [Parvibaculum sp.]
MSSAERPSSNAMPRPALADAARPQASRRLTGMQRALIYDDDDGFAEECAEALSRQGFIVETRAGRADFSRLVSEFAPHLVLLDLHMPEFDGIEALRALKEYGCKGDVEVILVSAAEHSLIVSASTLARAYGLRLRGVLRKPFRLSQLMSCVSDAGDDKISQI